MTAPKTYSLADFGVSLSPTPAQPVQPLREAVGAVLDEDRGWRTLTGNTRRDLTPLGQAQMQRLAAFLWESNLLANRLIELPLAFLLAEGVRLTCPDPEHQKWLDAFWFDPINKMDLRLPTFVRELALFGEQCLPVYVNEVNGHVRVGYLDPTLIEHVLMDPGNAAQEVGVVTIKDDKGAVRRFKVIVRGEDEELFAAEARALRARMDSGECFYFAVNKFAAGRRGRSDLIAQMDFLDGYDEFMFDQMERNSDLDAFIWDVTMTGASAEEVAAFAKDQKKPGRGSVRVHNDQVAWKAEAPNLNAADRAEAARTFRNHILAGSSIPEHFAGGGGDVNRAAASEMGDPFYKTTTMRQSFLKHMLVEMGSYVLWSRARASGQVPDWGDPAWTVEASFPELVSKDVTKLAAALASTVAAVSSAIGERLITRETGLKIVAMAAQRLDVEIDPEAELAAVAEEDPPPDETGPGGTSIDVEPGDEDDSDEQRQPGSPGRQPGQARRAGNRRPR